MEKINQQDRVLGLFKTGFMGSKQQMRAELGIENVGARISELKNDLHHDIRKVMKTAKNRFGEKVRFALYFLVAPGVRRVF